MRISPLVDTTLLNTQKAEVFEIFRSNEVDPHQFEWGEARSRFSSKAKISFLRSKARPEFSFTFDFLRGDYHPHCSPWHGVRQYSFGAIAWSDCLFDVLDWALMVQAELATADPWKALPGVATTTELAPAANVANTEFSHRETERLEKGLDELRRLFTSAAGDSPQKLAAIHEQLNALLDASKRMGRKDWVNQAIGAIITLSITLGLQPEVTKQAFEILRQTLTGLVHLVPQIIASGHQLM